MLRASFALLHFDACICSYTGVYLHLDRRRSEIPPDLTMTKITDGDTPNVVFMPYEGADTMPGEIFRSNQRFRFSRVLL